MAEKQKVLLKRSSVPGKMPSEITGSTVDLGELFLNIASGDADNFLTTLRAEGSSAVTSDYIKWSDDVANEKKFATKEEVMDNELVVSTIITKINESVGLDENSDSVLPNGESLSEAIIALQEKTYVLPFTFDDIFQDIPIHNQNVTTTISEEATKEIRHAVANESTIILSGYNRLGEGEKNWPNGGCLIATSSFAEDVIYLHFYDAYSCCNLEFEIGRAGDVYCRVNENQYKLISGENIKTINGKSILGIGNIDIHDEPYILPFTMEDINKYLARGEEYLPIGGTLYEELLSFVGTNKTILINYGYNNMGFNGFMSASNIILSDEIYLHFMNPEGFHNDIYSIAVNSDSYVSASKYLSYSEENIKSINGTSLYGDGDISITTDYYLPIDFSQIVDAAENNNTISIDPEIYDKVCTAIDEGRRVAVFNTADGNGIVYATCELNFDLVYLTFIGAYSATAAPRFFGVELDRGSAYIYELQYLKETIKIDYNSLKQLRSDSRLIPGMKYRIIDYRTTTSQENTRSAEHQFDIIVTALDNHTLSEEASACLHDGDTYFSSANAKLGAWKLKYSLDNDINRFAWADEAKGKGVIYYMKDEWNNECPYDFKNIKFLRGIYNYGYIAPDGEEEFTTYCYTFGWLNEDDTMLDTTIFGNNGYLLNDNGQISGVYGNIIKEYFTYTLEIENPTSVQLHLNNMVFLSTYYYYGDNIYYGYRNNSFGYNCYNNSFGNVCHNNSFGDYCYSNSFGDDCYNNSFGEGCYNNSFGYFCNYNSFGNNFQKNSFGTECCNNSFGDGCYNNSFEGYCYNNSFGKGSHNNSFGDDCCSNSFGDDCHNNSFGGECDYNSFGYYCYNNSFGDYCYSNSFGDYCHNNSFGDDCTNNSFGNECESNSFSGSCFNNSFENSCSGNTFGASCSGNSFGINCLGNSFGDYCERNSFGDVCENNSFGYYCKDNSFRNYCQRNSFSDGCYGNSFVDYCAENIFGFNCGENSFGTNCSNNSFGDECENNSFVNICSYNSFGEGCSINSFGNYCQRNSFGEGCSINSFGESCQYINFGESPSVLNNNYFNNSFGNSCRFINLVSSGGPSGGNIRNYKITQGLQGDYFTPITITAERGRGYETKVAKNSAGEIKIYCEADLIA